MLGFSPAVQAEEPPMASALVEPVTSVPGWLVLVGGGSTPEAVRDRFLQLAKGKQARLVIIPTASAKADTIDPQKRFGYWQARDVASVVMLHTRSRAQANDPTFARCLHDATGVWISGGDQTKLVDAYRGTMVEHELHDLLVRGGVIGGTSAGAAVMSSVMITGGNPAAQVDAGFGLFPGVVVDQHLMRRNRVPRLLSALTTHPGYFGIGIDEQTAVVVHDHTLTVLGEATARLCFAPSAKEAADVKILHSGDQADLASLSRSAVARARLILGKDHSDATAAHGGKNDAAHAAKSEPMQGSKSEPMHAMK
jgi:cyanophycinase